jgi:hypothetical protein
MLEKSSTLVLTDDDLAQFRAGKVSDRVSSNWGLTFSELQEIVENNNYTIINN